MSSRGITITANQPLSEQEREYYLNKIMEEYPDKKLRKLDIQIDEKTEEAEVTCTFIDAPFTRIRRITGYLVGGLDRFNDAKRAEEQARVKHV